MPLRAIECEGFKALSGPTTVDVRPITVIFGRNNSGKTTLARLPIFAAASLIERKNLFSLTHGEIRFASSFLDLASVDQAHPRISFGLRWNSPSALRIQLQHVTADISADSVQPRLLGIDDHDPIPIQLESSPANSAGSQLHRALSRSDKALLESHRQDLSEILRNTIHIASARPRIESTYSIRETTTWTTADVPYLLAARPTLMDAVSEWFRDSLDGTRVGLNVAAFAFRLVEEKNRSTVSLAESGRGTQAVLPVTTLLLALINEHVSAEVLVVEEPEEHLHPSAHGALGDLMIRASKVCQIIIETHSENLILRLRRRIAEGAFSSDDLGLYYIDQIGAVTEVKLDSLGSAINWPSGVFENDVDEARAIMHAKLAAMGSME